jgi:hypothetical protein
MDEELEAMINELLVVAADETPAKDKRVAFREILAPLMQQREEAREERDAFLERSAQKTLTIQPLEGLLQRAVPLLQHTAILEAMPEQQRDQANDLVEEIRTTLGREE